MSAVLLAPLAPNVHTKASTTIEVCPERMRPSFTVSMTELKRRNKGPAVGTSAGLTVSAVYCDLSAYLSPSHQRVSPQARVADLRFVPPTTIRPRVQRFNRPAPRAPTIATRVHSVGSRTSRAVVVPTSYCDPPTILRLIGALVVPPTVTTTGCDPDGTPCGIVKLICVTPANPVGTPTNAIVAGIPATVTDTAAAALADAWPPSPTQAWLPWPASASDRRRRS